MAEARSWVIQRLEPDDTDRITACAGLIEGAFADAQRYAPGRILAELASSSGPFYRQFFLAECSGEVVGVGGVKAADWSSHTHLLYLSAVRRDWRGQGIGRALIQARLDWIESSFPAGRILVSTPRIKRFLSMGFRLVANSRLEGRALMMRRFP